MKTYAANNIRFNFPANWTVEESRDEEQTTVTVQSEATAFWSVTIFDQPQDAQHVLDQVLDTLKDEYGTLDIYEVEARICGLSGISIDVEFICLELVNGAFLRSIPADGRHLLVYYQATDHELETIKVVMEAMSHSLQLDFDPTPGGLLQ